MSYSNNVSELAEAYGLCNPLLEESLGIKSVTFTGWGDSVIIPATDMNRAGRFFIEHLYTGMRVDNRMPGHHLYIWDASDKAKAQKFFDENWLDAEEKGRKMLMAMKVSKYVKIEWKS